MWQQRQSEVRALGGGTVGIRPGAAPVGVGDGRGAGPHRGIVGEGGPGPGAEALTVRGEFAGDGFRAVANPIRSFASNVRCFSAVTLDFLCHHGLHATRESHFDYCVVMGSSPRSPRTFLATRVALRALGMPQ
ncbi:hypothetical protein Srufu_061780 [Streptomyces libani subsp. rufus]|nr:hypothetical protein Srufu_061780 [Streptomyces libani subsp. rufus]